MTINIELIKQVQKLTVNLNKFNDITPSFIHYHSIPLQIMGMDLIVSDFVTFDF